MSKKSRCGILLELWKCRHLSRLRKIYIYCVGWTFLGGWIRLKSVQHAFRQVSQSPEFILDAGCGEGANTVALAECFPSASIKAIDWESTEQFQGQLESLKDMLFQLGMKDITLEKKNLFDLKDHHQFNLILNVDVLEHIPGNRKILTLFFEALKPDGELILHVPRAGEPAKSSFFPQEVIDSLAEEHIGEMYDAAELEKLLEDTGFSDVHVVETFYWLAQTAWEWDRIVYQRIRLLYPLIFPCLKLMAWLGLYIKFGRSFGLLAVAKRPK